MKLYCDGSSQIGVKSAYCVTSCNGTILAHQESFFPNDKTSNEEEYRAVIKALEICKEGDEIFSDSQLVVMQIIGRFKVKQPHLKPLCEMAIKLAKEKNVRVNWTPREKNKAGEFFEK
jgi:ribonuclease HI